MARLKKTSGSSTKYSSSKEDYLKAIFHLQESNDIVTTNDLAAELQTSPASVEKLLFRWDEVHEIAEELEHISSKKLIDRLDEFLEFPKTDPHGDPIPDSNGKWTPAKQLNLHELPLNKSAVVCSIGDQSASMLELLTHKHIMPGTRLEIRKRFAFDNSMELKIKNHPPITVSEEVAKNVYVKYDE